MKMPGWVRTLAATLALGASAFAGPPEPLGCAGIQAGVCVHILSGRGADTAAMGADGTRIVHALSPNDEVTGRVRAAAHSRGLYGLVSVETRAKLGTLPYAKHLVNLVVVDDLAEATGRGLSWPEVMRVTAPGGVVLVGGTSLEQVKEMLARRKLTAAAVGAAGPWVRIVTARPEWMGLWTHGRKCDAGGTGLADGRHDPESLGTGDQWIQWIDAEHRPSDHGSMTSLVATERLFVSITNAETASYARDGLIWYAVDGRKRGYVLSARDAYNGVPYWTRPWRGTQFAVRQLAAQGQFIYTIEDGKLTGTDAASGTIRFAVSDGKPYVRDDDLYCGPGVVAMRRNDGEVTVFDARTGEKRWRHAGPATEVGADGALLFLRLTHGLPKNPSRSATPTNLRRELIAMDFATGKELWRRSAEQLGLGQAEMALSSAGQGCVVLVARGGTVIVLDGNSGGLVQRVSAEAVGDRPAACVTDGKLLVRGARAQFYDLRTGRALRPEPFGPPRPLGVWACGGGLLTKQMFLDELTEKQPAGERPTARHEFLGSCGVNISCIIGPAMANGLIYQPQQYCGCAGAAGKTTGLVASSEIGPVPPREAFLAPGDLERGPAYGAQAAGAAGAEIADADWPAFRHDGQRSCAGRGNVPDKLAIAWRRPLATKRPVSRIIAASWRGQHFHNTTITAPVAAGGLVLVALVDEHEVVAMRAATGEVAWRFTADARIDSPPTIHRELCIFGCRDGRVYCLRAVDGRLVWRRRISPVDQRICVYGQLESRYPVIGSVFVDGEKAYATAGLSAAVGVMWFAFEPETGKVLEYRQLPRGQFLNDVILRMPDASLWMNIARVGGRAAQALPGVEAPPRLPGFRQRVGLDPAVPSVRNPPRPPAPLRSTHSGVLQTIRTTATLCSGHGWLMLDRLRGKAWAWDGKRAFGFVAGTASAARASPKAATGPGAVDFAAIRGQAVIAVDTSKLDDQSAGALLWQQPLADVWAIACTPNQVVSAGPEVRRFEDAAARRAADLPTDSAPTSSPAASSPAAPTELTPETLERMAAETEAEQKRLDAMLQDKAKRLAALRKTDVPDYVPPGSDPLWKARDVWDRWQPVQQDPLRVRGIVRIFDAATGRPGASLSLPATPVQDGIAITGGRVYVTTADGAVCCLAEPAR